MSQAGMKLCDAWLLLLIVCCCNDFGFCSPPPLNLNEKFVCDSGKRVDFRTVQDEESQCVSTQGLEIHDP